MASLSFYRQFETNLMLNREVIEFLLQLKSAKARGKNYIKIKPHLVRHLLRNRLLPCLWARLSDHIQGVPKKGPILKLE